jgi:phosphatidate cytidylyltransferase
MEEDIIHHETGASAAPSLRSELGKRLVSGIVFAGFAIGLAWAGHNPFALLVLIVAVVMSWEWTRVVRDTDLDLTLIVHAAAVAASTILAALGYAALGLATLIIGTITVLLLEFGRRSLYSAAGVLYAGLPAIALLWLRGSNHTGFRAVLFIFLVVWATDTLAFIAGRTVGGPKLAPTISPNKTWAGLAGGLIASTLTAAIFALFTGDSPWGLAVTGLAMGLIAQGGDLGESALKRVFGVKDVSDLIPGHGGFMDRMDGVVAVAVAAAFFALFVNPHAPAEALFR